MKEIEKMAIEYSKEHLDPIYAERTPKTGTEFGMQQQHYVAMEAIWKAGFRKARELAAKRVEGFFVQTGRIGRSESKQVPLDAIMREIGESEVKGE